MRKIYIIGSLHNMVSDKELKKVLDRINPDQIFIETINTDLKKNVRKSHKEMLYAYNWGIKQKKIVTGFDSSIKIENNSIARNEKNKIEKEMRKLASNYSWMEFNKKSNIKKFDKYIDKIIDKQKSKLRQEKMLYNINKRIINKGNILILTGVYHLDFFKENINGSIFPLRSKKS